MSGDQRRRQGRLHPLQRPQSAASVSDTSQRDSERARAGNIFAAGPTRAARLDAARCAFSAGLAIRRTGITLWPAGRFAFGVDTANRAACLDILSAGRAVFTHRNAGS